MNYLHYLTSFSSSMPSSWLSAFHPFDLTSLTKRLSLLLLFVKRCIFFAKRCIFFNARSRAENEKMLTCGREG